MIAWVIVILGTVAAVAGLILAAAWLIGRDDHRNPFPGQPEHTGFADIKMPPEIAHDRPGRIVWEHPCDCERCRDNPGGPAMLPPGAPDGAHDETPPMAAPPAAPGTTNGGAEPGDTAAAGSSTPPAPPPLPGPAEGARAVAACPERYPFEEWLRDDVAEAACALQGGAP